MGGFRILEVFLCLSAVAAADASCSATDGTCTAEGSAEQQAFIQTNKLHLQKVSRKDATALGMVNEDPDMLSIVKPEDFAALETASLLQQLKVELSEDGSRASVSFASEGLLHSYKLEAVSAYAEGANISIWTGSGYEYIHPGKPRTFRCREEGQFASARIHEDGSVSGLFEQQGGRVIDVRPLHKDDTEDDALALLAEHTEEGQAHIFSVTPPLDLARSPFASYIQQGDPYLPTDEEEKKFMGKPCDGCQPHPSGDFNAKNEWGGVKWYPGCYPGDSTMHTLMVGFAIPPNVFSGGAKNNWPTIEKAKARWEEILAKASWIYEKQMNVMLKLGDVKASKTGGPKWAMTGCGGEVRTMLNNMKSAGSSGQLNPQQASWHGFVNCGQSHGVMGVAYVGTLCKGGGGWNTGANKWQVPTSWFVYAHELGHNFAGKHSFEEGQGRTGGVMDYGDGKLNGHYQFNTKYRKNEICKHLKATKSCDSFKAGAAPPAPPPPPPGGKPPPGGGGGGGRYVKGPANTNKCPTDSTPITDVATCKQAADALKLKWKESENVGDYPKGCYYYKQQDDYQGVYYNSHGSGAAGATGEPICKAKACEIGPAGPPGPSGPPGPLGPRGPPGPPA